MQLKLILITITLIASGNWSVLAGEISNQLPNETIHPMNQTTGGCSPDCCDDNCDG
jgi:hypothetical protein